MIVREARPRHYIIAAIFLIIGAYALFQARFVLLGPRLAIVSHQDGAVVSEPLITLAGTAKNASHLSLNDRQIFTDTEGSWSERILLSEGINIATLRARDRFGHEKSEMVRIFLTQ